MRDWYFGIVLGRWARMRRLRPRTKEEERLLAHSLFYTWLEAKRLYGIDLRKVESELMVPLPPLGGVA